MKREGNFHEEIMQFSGKTDFREDRIRHNTAGAAFHDVFDLARRHFNRFGYALIGKTVNEPQVHDAPVPFIVDLL